MQEAYALLINNNYHIAWAEYDLANKLGNLRADAYDPENPDTELHETPQGYFHDSSTSAFHSKVDKLAHNFDNLPSKLPAGIRWLQCKLTYHALYFAKRLRHLDHAGEGPKPHLSPDHRCFLCKAGPDSFRHVYFACQTVIRAEQLLLLKHGYTLYHKNLDTLLLTDEILPKKILNFRVIFNYVVYSARCQVEDLGGNISTPKHLIALFEATAKACCPSLIGLSAKRQSSLSQLKRDAIAKVKQTLATAKPSTILAYTDGSANPNPGPAGAGFFLVHGQHTHAAYTSLGTGTNNIGELYAIGMACDHIIFNQNNFPHGTNTNIIFLTDSLYAIGVLTGGWRATSNLALIKAVKDKLNRLPFPYQFIYCPGHCGIYGNEQADEQAGQGTIDSASGLGTNIDQRLSYHSNDFRFPINNTGIQLANNLRPD
jgi:ribonuclease HI